MPTVSVILPVFNGIPYLEAAIRSVLDQTFQDFELIIIDDGSIDNSASVIGMFNNPKIQFHQQPNQGLAATLNRGISLAKGKYIARQDQDDVCFPLRLQKQVAFLDMNPNVAMVGTSAEIWVGNKWSNRLLTHPADDASIRFGLLFDNYFVHSSVMIRRSVLEKVGGYSEDKSRQPPEDYELWSRVMRSNKVANLPEVLMVYREVPSSMSRVGVTPFMRNLVKISAENIAWASDCEADSHGVVALSKLFHGDYEAMPHGVKYSELRLILDKAILRIAKESGVTPQHMMAMSRGMINRLQYRYVDYCSGGLVGRAMHGRIGRFAKSMARRLMMKAAH